MNIFRLPDLGEGLQEAELVQWHVAPGQEVAADQPLVSVETAKAVVEIPSPQAGRIEKLFAEAGEIVRIGGPLIGFVGARDESADKGTVVGAMETSGRVLQEGAAGVDHGVAGVRATPAVRALARRLEVDLGIVTPSGPDGVITASDVQRVARILSETEPAEPLRGFRRAMAQNMALAQAEVAAATVVDDADIEDWAQGTDTTLRLIRALVCGCRAEPALNAWFESHALARRVLKRVDLGIAVDSGEGGLFVPVLRNVAERDPADLRDGLNRMRADIESRAIPPEELRGATITLSNFGMIAGRYAAPVVLPPTVAILGAGRVRRAAVPDGERIVARRLLPLSLTFDHRVVTGGEAARFLRAVIDDLALAA
ncbi:MULTISPECIES: dihydrolipoamide acetyltransferase family protein [Methylosinus]|uniref:Dihydrolipoamide acetyltransferase component of pyruvate dehydrogenase complex n=1 Tax=Methylosinus trichosporium (strain ATCC 35070 / NCIMB 11131 / UNIQEM 75 / OB3b) TaxID=595536 RepID=A0A2D2CY01_METT3|nr:MULTISPECIES: dihydrolipoamide acetyltransferase family protein [Methylosinus]ATQ67617.1 2-oxo acid dehydrogenase subunit E2 [Methylosinus trichosporium OB3b]OBS52158.1 branched-chain alpha-keto acid dehydrogenase subunit E2 [Methylosinus sp. 3S-1]